MLISVTQVRSGMTLQIDGTLFRVMKTQHVAPGNVRGAMQTTMRNLANGSKVEKRLRTNDRVERVTVESQDMEYLYADGNEYVFMHPETYEQINVHKDLLEDSLPYLLPNTRTTVDVFEGNVIGVSLPTTVDLTVSTTEPALRGATASASMKPATLETGHNLNVPLFINEGETIKVDTRNGQYVERVT